MVSLYRKENILIGILEWSECDSQNDCIDDLFNNLLETDPKLEFPIFENFEDLFSRGLFEHLSFDMTRGGNTPIDLHGGDLKLPCLIVPQPAR